MTTFYQGEAGPIFITLKDDAGELLDLTDATVRYIVYPREGGSVLIDKEAVIVSAGYVRVDIDEADTGFQPKQYVEEARIWLPSGVIRTFTVDGFTLARSGFHELP